MAFSDQQIRDAYNTSLAQGFTADQIQQGALSNFGISASQFNSAIAGGSAAPASAPAAAPASAPSSAPSVSQSSYSSSGSYDYSSPYTAPPPAYSYGAPAPSPAAPSGMSGYTDQQIRDAYNASRAAGFSDTDIQRGALSNYGITADRFNGAVYGLGGSGATGLLGTANAPSVASFASSPMIQNATVLNSGLNDYAGLPGAVSGQLPGAGQVLTTSSPGQYYTPSLIQQLAAQNGGANAATRDYLFRQFGVKPTEFDAAMGTTGGTYGINAGTYGGVAANGYSAMNGQQTALEIARLMTTGGMGLDQAKQTFLANGGTAAQLYQGAGYLGQPNTGAAGNDLFAQFGAASYDPTTAIKGVQLIDPATGGPNLKSGAFDANGNRIATDSGVAYSNIKQVVGNILANQSLSDAQKADVIGAYAKSRQLMNDDIAVATGIDKGTIDQFVKSNLINMKDPWLSNQYANYALDKSPAPVNPAPVFDQPQAVPRNGDGIYTLYGQKVSSPPGVPLYQISPVLSVFKNKDGSLGSFVVSDPKTGQSRTANDPLQALYVMEQFGYVPDPAIFAGVQSKLEGLGITNVQPTSANDEKNKLINYVGPLNLDMVSKGYLGGLGFDPTTSTNVSQKGPSALGSLQQAQALANRYGFLGGNTSTLGLDIPGYITEASPRGGLANYDLTNYGVNPYGVANSAGMGLLTRDAILPGSLQTQSSIGGFSSLNSIAPGGNRYTGNQNPYTQLVEFGQDPVVNRPTGLIAQAAQAPVPAPIQPAPAPQSIAPAPAPTGLNFTLPNYVPMQPQYVAPIPMIGQASQSPLATSAPAQNLSQVVQQTQSSTPANQPTEKQVEQLSGTAASAAKDESKDSKTSTAPKQKTEIPEPELKSMIFNIRDSVGASKKAQFVQKMIDSGYTPQEIADMATRYLGQPVTLNDVLYLQYVYEQANGKPIGLIGTA